MLNNKNTKNNINDKMINVIEQIINLSIKSDDIQE